MERRVEVPAVINTSLITSVCFPCLPHSYLWGNKNSAPCSLEFLSLYSTHRSLWSQAYDLWLRLSLCVSHTAPDIELKSVEKGFFFFFFYRRGKWFMSSAINQSEPKQLNSRTNLSWKNWRFPEETILNINPFLCVDNYICFKFLNHWKWWHI